jgi:chromate transporter
MAEIEATREQSMTSERAGPLSELAWLFLKLGATAFGGPAAHIAMMEDEVVHRRGWLTHQEFVDMLGVTNLLPGPNSTEMAIHIGWSRARWPGLVVAGLCFILPAVLIVGALAWVYARYGTRPEAAALFYGIKPVVIAIVLQALARLGRTATKTRGLCALALAGAVFNLYGVNELLILFGSGLAVAAATLAATRRERLDAHLSAAVPIVAAPAGVAAAAPFGLWPLFLFFLKVGSVLFGSGYVLLAFLRADLVERWHWMTESRLLDAIAVGQVTPGPVFTTATFIGYVLGGTAGAVVATVGIFLPAFAFVAASGPLVPRIRRSRAAAAFLDGVNAASLALMVVVTWELARACVVDVPTAVLAAASTAILARFHVNSTWVILAGAALGLLASARWVA